MSTLEEQKASNKGVGWGKVIVGRFKEDVEQLKTKFQNIVGGIEATPRYFKKKKKTVKETDLLKGKDYYPPQP
jgi:hypothetical protein